MNTLTYGQKIPESGDVAKGSSGWFKAIEDNFTRLDAHTHDGVTSPSIPYSSLSPYTGTILAANWASSGSGYSQTITVPGGVTEINNYNVKFIFTAPAGFVGEVAYLDYDRVSATSYTVYCNDNTAAFTVLYR